MKRICVLGGYGIFGSRIAESLIQSGFSVIIAGRSTDKALAFKNSLIKQYPNGDISTLTIDLKKKVDEPLKKASPFLIINTCGPFQSSDHTTAKACIDLGIHYIDLADGRDFVHQITSLDASAKQNQTMVITGSSTVPGLSSAVLDHYIPHFSVIQHLDFGITPGAKTPRGVATARSILSYIGKPLKPFPGGKKVFGWQGIHRVKYPELGFRWMGACDVPDLDCLPQHYPIQSLRFCAGMESSLLHLSIWLISWLIRLHFPFNFSKHAASLTTLSHLFDCFGSHDGGMHMIIRGLDKQGKSIQKKWFVIVKDGDGPHVPTIPSIVLAKKIIQGTFNKPGAYPCVGLVSLDEYKKALQEYASTFHED